MTLLRAAALYLVLGAVFLEVKVLSVAQSPTGPSVSDLVAYYYPMLRYGFDQMRAGALPLWNPHQLAGVPLLASPIVGFLYPLYVTFLFLPPATAITVDIVLHLAIAGVTMHLLCRALGMRAPAALVAGIVFAFQGGMMIKLHYPSYLASVAWMPAIFLLTHRILERPTPRRCALLAATFGVSLLGGHGLQFAYFTAWTLVPLVAYGVVRRWRHAGARVALRATAVLACAFGLGVALAAVRLVPAAELARESWRPPGSLPIEVSASMSADPSIFLRNLVSAEPSPHPQLGLAYPGVLREGYVGIVPLALALAGVVLWRARGMALAIAGIGAGSVLYAFGPHAFVYPILYHLPGGSWFRGPDRALVVFGFAVAVLCGAGLDEIGRRSSAWRPALGALAIVAIGALAAARGTGAWLAVLYCAVAAALVGWPARALRGHRARSALALAIAALVLVDLWRGTPVHGALPSQLGTYFARLDPFVREVLGAQGLERTYIWASFRPDDPLYFFSDVAKAGQVHGLWLPTDYEGLASARIERYLRFQAPGAFLEGWPIDPFGYVPLHLAPSNVRLASLLGIRFFLIQDSDKERYLDPSLDVERAWRLVRREAGVSLYEDPHAVPRAFVAPSIVTIEEPDRLLDRLSAIDPLQVALVEQPVAVPPAAGGTAGPSQARISEYRPGRVVVETSGPPGLLVLTDQYYPGWQATVDGEPAPILRADYLFRGVPVPAGDHRVEFAYRPATFRTGATISSLALAAILAVSLASLRRPGVRRARRR